MSNQPSGTALAGAQGVLKEQWRIDERVRIKPCVVGAYRLKAGREGRVSAVRPDGLLVMVEGQPCKLREHEVERIGAE